MKQGCVLLSALDSVFPTNWPVSVDRLSIDRLYEILGRLSYNLQSRCCNPEVGLAIMIRDEEKNEYLKVRGTYLVWSADLEESISKKVEKIHAEARPIKSKISGFWPGFMLMIWTWMHWEVFQ
jgi:hypothetical protein